VAKDVWIGRDTGEQAECLGALEDRHAATIDGAAAEGTRRVQQRGFQREVNDFGDPKLGTQQRRRQRCTGILVHADRRRVDNSVCYSHGGCDIPADLQARFFESSRQTVDQALRLGQVDV
jgi:hypothetical protein